MLDFTYYTPTKVFFGKGQQENVGKIIYEYGYKKIMLQYGKQSIKKNGLYDEVMSSLLEYGIEVIEAGGVEPNPKVSFVRDAVKIAKEEKVEMILAVGGGSVIDSSKATALGAVADADIWDIYEKKVTPKGALPVGCILTHSAAGSEMSWSAVLTNTELSTKRGCTTDFNRCLFAICNPELTFTVSPYQTACGIVDILSHTMERYFSVCGQTELTDSIAESVMKSVVSSGIKAIENPKDYEARATLMWASSLSHNNLTGCGRKHTMAVHQLEHALSGEYDSIAHGAGLAVLFPAWAKFVYKKNVLRFAQFARRVWDVDEACNEKCALLGIEKMEEFFRKIKMPLKLYEFGLSEDCTQRLSELCTYNKTRTIESYIELDFDNINEIFKSCF